MDALIFITILTAIVLGFYLGRRSFSSLSRPVTASAHDRYLEGLKYLLNEQSDAAIDALVADLEINQITLETYFSLGSLWRKRGEMERAIRVHQTLLTSPTLTSTQRQQAQLELALDYSHAGVLDRSEVLLKELVLAAHSSVKQSAGRELVLLYQEEREWDKAIASVDELCSMPDLPDTVFWRYLQAHYYCELAERILSAPDWNDPEVFSRGIPLRGDSTSSVLALLAKAECRTARHPRVLLLRALLALGQPDLKSAQLLLRNIILEPAYSMVLVPLMLSVRGDGRALRNDLLEFYRDSEDPAVLPFLADLLYHQDGREVAVSFVIQELLSQQNELESLGHLLTAFDPQATPYDKIGPTLKQLLPFHFHCRQCGFQGRHFYWCCPSCKTWL